MSNLTTKDIQDALERFEYKGVARSDAWHERVFLSEQLLRAIRSKDADRMVVVLRSIHRWGFGKDLPQGVCDQRHDLLRVLRKVMRAKSGPDRQDLIWLLGLPEIGIAAVSKWICFVDQNRYAIFDSRVSVALKECRENGSRSFPVLQRKGNNAWPPDQFKSLGRMADFYLDYLALLQRVAKAVQLKPAEIEMGLFMIGDIPCDNPEAWKENRGPLRRY